MFKKENWLCVNVCMGERGKEREMEKGLLHFILIRYEYMTYPNELNLRSHWSFYIQWMLFDYEFNSYVINLFQFFFWNPCIVQFKFLKANIPNEICICFPFSWRQFTLFSDYTYLSMYWIISYKLYFDIIYNTPIFIRMFLWVSVLKECQNGKYVVIHSVFAVLRIAN